MRAGNCAAKNLAMPFANWCTPAPVPTSKYHFVYDIGYTTLTEGKIVFNIPCQGISMTASKVNGFNQKVDFPADADGYCHMTVLMYPGQYRVHIQLYGTEDMREFSADVETENIYEEKQFYVDYKSVPWPKGQHSGNFHRGASWYESMYSKVDNIEQTVGFCTVRNVDLPTLQ